MELFPALPVQLAARRHKITEYRLAVPGLSAPCTLAVAADLHGGAWHDLLPALQKADAILIPGDLLDRRRRDVSQAVAFARAAAALAPAYYSMGNHEARYAENFPAQFKEYRRAIRRTGVVMLNNEFVRDQATGLVVGGLSEPASPSLPALHRRAAAEKSERFLEKLAAQKPAPRVLLCHRPESYRRMAEKYGMELVLAGHAHGGQISVLGRGIYAPGQGLFPRDTAGIYPGSAGGAMLVSRGLTNTVAPLPRWGNPTELLLVHLTPMAGEESV